MTKQDILGHLNKEKFDVVNNASKKFIDLAINGIFTTDDMKIETLETEYGTLYIPKYYTENAVQFESIVAERLFHYNCTEWDLIPLMKYTVILISKNNPAEFIGLKGNYKKYLQILIEAVGKIDSSLIQTINNPKERINTLLKELDNNLPQNVYLPFKMIRFIQNDYEEISEDFMDIISEKLGFTLRLF